MSQYDDHEAAHQAHQAGISDADAALRAYTANLYARSVWLHGAGRFVVSVKRERQTAFGGEQELLACAGGHGDHIAVTDIASYDQPLLHRASDAMLGAEERQQALYRSRLRSPHDDANPILHNDVWLHTMVGRKWVDFVHPGSSFASLWRDSVGRVVRALEDPGLVAVAFDADPHRLGQALHNAYAHKPHVNAALIARRGVLVWGDDPRKVYERMQDLLAKLDAQISRYVELPSVTDHRSDELSDARRRFAQSLRGSANRIGCGWQVCAWRHGAELQAVLRNRDVLQAARDAWLVDQPATLAGEPLVLEELAGLNAEALAADLDKLLLHARSAPPGNNQQLWPQVVLIPDLGLVAIAADRATAERRASAWAHTLHAIATAQALSLYQPNPPRPDDSLTRPLSLAAAQAARLPLSGRIALVTGVGSGIGSATARAMLAAGAHVTMCGRDERVLEAVGEWPAQRYGQRVLLQLCDVRHDAECVAAVQATCDAFGGIDILVSNTGANASGAIYEDSGNNALIGSLETNLLAHQRIARHATAAMLQQRSGGVLLFNAAKSAFFQGPGYGPYAVAKAALVSLMRQYAIDLGRHGIRANAVNADRIRTNLVSDGLLHDGGSVGDLSPSRYFLANLLRREATPELVADAFVYLATAAATTGCIITVDSGNPAAFPR